MPNYDMSQQACRERADHAHTHEGLKEAIVCLHEMSNLNRKAIETLTEMVKVLKEEISCLKQQS